MCPIGLASFLLGDKWIPLIIRDIALFDRRTFNHMLNSNQEGISSGSLSSRLKQMLHLNLLHVERSEEHIQKKLVTAQDVSRELLYSAEAQLSDQLT
jgi:DNA-binding HxlR family transcriptional regulator